jgi:hypothetical protein
MAWIKRNLYFVITIVVGLGLAGFCGYLLYSAMGDNATASSDYATAMSSLDSLQKKTPFPSKENIELAEADAARVRDFLDEFKKPFAGFPTPPKMDDRQFKDHLLKYVNQFGLEATNAGVGLYPGYAFGFSQQMGQLNFPGECITPWLQEMEEMQALLHIFFKAKINFLEEIKRPGVNPDDLGNDIDQFTISPSSFGIVSPYVVNFRAFSAELADVLTGIAASSNCFIIKAVYVSPSRAPIEFNDVQAAPTPPMQQMTRPAPMRDRPGMLDENGQPRDFRMGGRSRMPEAQPEMQGSPSAAAPVKILWDKPLFVTIYVDVVKLKEPEAPARAAKPKTAEH